MFCELPIKQDTQFVDAPGELGGLWMRVSQAENALAMKLKDLPRGTAVICGDEVWFLMANGKHRVLHHGSYVGGEISELSNRFDLGLDWVDFEEGDLLPYAERVENAIESFQTVELNLNANGDEVVESADLVLAKHQPASDV